MAFLAAIPQLVSTGAGIIGNIISGNNTANAIKKASQAQQAGADAGIRTIQGNNALNASLYAPYLNSGASALAQLDELLGLGSSPASVLPATATTAPDYAAYVRNNPDLLAQYQAQTGYARGRSMADYGQQMWSNFDNSGRTYTPFGAAPKGWNPQDPNGSLSTGQPAPGGGQSPAQQQQAAIDQLKASPLYQSLFHNGEQATLANAAATGGLRGGNAERSLYNLGNDTLAQVIQQQVANLGGLAGAGQQGAGSLAGLNTNSAGTIANLQGQSAGYQAGGIMGGANAANSMIKGLTNGLSSLAGNQQLLSALGLGGGVTQASTSNILGPDYSYGSQVGSPMNLNTSMNLSAVTPVGFAF